MTKKDDIDSAVVLICGSIALLIGLSLIPTGLWYCFDDMLADVVGVPAVGNVPPLNVWAATLFCMMVTNRSRK